MAGKLAFLHALSSLHCGTGQGVGSIDLPIARERATNLPFVPGSTIKGCVRDALEPGPGPEHKRREKDWLQIFGPRRGEDASAFAGALRISDAHLLMLPVRCLSATFVWTTCPLILHRFHRDALAAGHTELPGVPSLKAGEARLASAEPLITLNGKKKLVLEELDFTAEVDAGAAKWCKWISSRLFAGSLSQWQAECLSRFAIVDDNNFAYLSEFATEVNAHIAIDQDSGTVKPGALWYQESLPAESVCYFLLQASPSGDKRPGAVGDKSLDAAQVVDSIPESSDIQFGGKASTGLGIARIVPFGAAK